ncbi:MAG: hypothetical protein NZ700_04215 [Gemmataceae bacterium]|nr:hypothetical protein [Gemmataceae bacterium]MDW8266608.1 hypothetical protein [Gemmataceae bacterium]
MLTSYMVKCPHVGCDWRGSLLPRGDKSAWRGITPTTPRVVFECPNCARTWQARVVGDDVEPLPLEEFTPERA